MFRSLKIEAADTAIIDSEMTEWIAEVDEEIDSRLFYYYTTPVLIGNSPKSYKILQRIATWKVAHQAKTVLELTSQKSDKEQELQTNLEMKANALLKKIIPKWDEKAKRWQKALMPLTDATAKAVSPETASIMSHQSLTPIFTKDGDNW